MGSDGTHLGHAAARAGLAGNPSDALGGAALAVPVPGLWAEVELSDSDRVSVRGPAADEHWPSVTALVEHADRYGHEGGDRLVTAAIVTLRRYARSGEVDISDSPFEASWSSNIPRSVGLAGSSAVVVAAMRALSRRWGMDLSPATLAALALAAERDELGVAAGWMDRATQAHDTATLVETGVPIVLDGVTAVEMAPVVVAEPFELVVAWDVGGAAPSGRVHGRLRERLDAGDRLVVDAVAALLDAARQAAAALRSGDRAALADAMETTRGQRVALGALDPATARLAEIAATRGAVATSAGSGGAVSALPSEVDGAVEVVAEFERLGFDAIVVTVR